MSVSVQAEAVEFLGHGGLRLAADCYGDASAVPVILLHGGGQDKRSWRGVAARLASAGY